MNMPTHRPQNATQVPRDGAGLMVCAVIGPRAPEAGRGAKRHLPRGCESVRMTALSSVKTTANVARPEGERKHKNFSRHDAIVGMAQKNGRPGRRRPMVHRARQ